MFGYRKLEQRDCMQSDQVKLLLLALSRYPDLEPRLALHCFQSDRGAAGLGALKSAMLRELRPGQEIVRCKDFDPMRFRVTWTLAVRRDARLEMEEPQPELVPWKEMSEVMTVTTVAIPAVNEKLCVPMNAQELRTQAGRSYAASLLWHARRKLREMTR